MFPVHFKLAGRVFQAVGPEFELGALNVIVHRGCRTKALTTGQGRGSRD